MLRNRKNTRKLFLKDNQRYLKTKRLFSSCSIRWKKNFLNCFKNEIKSVLYTSIFTVLRVVILLFLKNPKRYLNSGCAKIFFGFNPKILKRVFENIFKNKVRRAKKLSILLHFYISLCGYLTFPQKLLEIFKFSLN